jgi:hypothetical protein
MILGSLEKFLTELSGKRSKPFAFKLSGEVTDAMIHIVNLPDGRKISSREEAHEGLVKYEIRNESCDLIGFSQQSIKPFSLITILTYMFISSTKREPKWDIWKH